jgi:transposase-like protein
MQGDPAALKERAVTLAVASEHPSAQTARDLGGNDNALYPWLGPYPRVERQEQQGTEEHRSEELTRLRKEHAR